MEEIVKAKETFTVTNAAALYLKNAILDREEVVGVRVGVSKRGCSGNAYTVEYAEKFHDSDAVFEQGGVKVIVDKIILAKFLQGTELDFVVDGVQEGLKFNNPKATASCGCGESFIIKE